MIAEKDKCKNRVHEHLTSRINDLRRLWAAECKGVESVEDLGNIYEYGLSFDYVAPETFGKDQRRGYFRYQISWGGPSDEFRFYTDERLQPERIEYWFLDWFDGAKVILHGGREKLMLEIWEWFKEGGTVEAKMKEALEV